MSSRVLLLLLCWATLVSDLQAQMFGFNKKSSGDDLYAALGVPRRASQEEIKRAFRKRTREVHPDLKETVEEKASAKDEMAKILRAYDVLSDEVKRDTYDKFGVVAGENGVPSDGGAGGNRPGDHFGFNPFFRQHQRAEPIKSKTHTIANVAEYRELVFQTKREPTILLVQAYHDACLECRLVSGPWENLANSGWAYGAVRMARVAVDQGEDASAILHEAGVTYGPAPVVFAVLSGSVVSLSHLPGVLFRERQAMIQPMLFDFVQSFFVDTPLAAQEVVLGLDQLERSLKRAAHDLRPTVSAPSVAVLLSHNVDRGLAHSIYARHTHTQVLLVDRATMVQLLVDVCRLPNIDASVTELISLLPLAAVAHPSDRAGLLHSGVWCPHMHAASSSSHLSATRALAFVAKHFQVMVRSAAHSADVGGDRAVELLDSASAARSCGTSCVVLLMSRCTSPASSSSDDTRASTAQNLGGLLKSYVNKGSDASTIIPVSDLLEDLTPFRSMFLCLDSEPDFAKALVALASRSHVLRRLLTADPESLDAALLIMTRRGSSGKAILLPRHAKNPTGRFVKLQALLADIVEDIDHQLRSYEIPNPNGGDNNVVDELVTSLASRSLQVQWWRRFAWKLWELVDAASGLFALLPLVLIWYAMKWCSSPRRDGSNPRADPPHSRQRGSGIPSAASSSGADHRISPMYHVPFFIATDIREAENGKGFLVLIFHRKVLSLPGPLPMSLLSDGRFTIRVVEEQHSKWWRWLDELMVRTGRKPSSVDPSPQFVAIRKGRMLAELKPSHTTVSVWCSELLDGSCVPSYGLPK